MKNKIYNIPLYGGTFEIVFYHEDERIIIEEKYGIKSLDGYSAVTIQRGNKHKVFFETKKVTPGIIAHEAKHNLNYIFNHIGQQLDLENDEAECYLLGWIVNRIHESCRKFNIKIK